MADKGYVIKVKFPGGYRTLRIEEQASFLDLATDILEAVEFTSEHLWAFFLDGKPYSDDGIAHPYALEDNDWANAMKEKLKKHLKVGDKFLFLYDFGADWEFPCEVLAMEEGELGVIDEKGEAPQQYDGEEYVDEDYNEEDGDLDYLKSRNFILPILAAFGDYLEAQELKEETIAKHVDNVGLYLIDYANAETEEEIDDAIDYFDPFVTDYYMEFCEWASKTDLKSICSSVKKFYQWRPSDKDALERLCGLIKENLPSWLEEFK